MYLEDYSENFSLNRPFHNNISQVEDAVVLGERAILNNYNSGEKTMVILPTAEAPRKAAPTRLSVAGAGTAGAVKDDLDLISKADRNVEPIAIKYFIYIM